MNDVRTSLVDVIKTSARVYPSRVAYRFLNTRNGESRELTLGELDALCRSVAGALHERAKIGSRIVLLYDSGPDFVVAFFACLYAGLVAVPCSVPRRSLAARSRLANVIEDCRPSLVLVDDARPLLSAELRENFAGQFVLNHGDLNLRNANSLESVSIVPDDIALLQYTSGSTSSPRGVKVTHRNLIANVAAIQDGFQLDESSIGVLWLPHHHDMGLIGGIVAPILIGFTMTLFRPEEFVVRPYAWLRAISDYRATVSGGPNFSYDMCVSRIAETDRQTLDLSSWRVAFSGAEPVRAATLSQFADTFKASGFRREALFPCYGLAENTLYATGGPVNTPPRVRRLDADALRRGSVRDTQGGGSALVSSGFPAPGNGVVITAPDTGAVLPAETIGEIWLSGPCVANGYWGDDVGSETAFHAKLNGRTDSFLRTGDLGFVDSSGELFVTGRIKDLMIVRGANIYPHDIEETIESALPEVKSAAFTITANGVDVIIVAVECGGRFALAHDTAEAILRRMIADVHDVAIETVIFLRPNSLPRTTSGKLQRHKCQEMFEAGMFAAVLATERASPEGVSEILEDEVTKFLRAIVGVTDEGVKPLVSWHTPLVQLGINSLRALQFIAAIEQEFGVALPLSYAILQSTLYEIATLVRHEKGIAADQVPQSQFHGEAEAVDPSVASLYFLDQLHPESPVHNISRALRLSGTVDEVRFEEALNAMLRRHPVLRSRLLETPQGLKRIVEATCSNVLECHDATSLSWSAVLGLMREISNRPFDLSAGPLLRATLLRVGLNDHVLLLCAHHVAVDMHSLVILLDDLDRALRNQPLEVRSDPVTYVEPERDGVEFWRKTLQGASGAFLPVDFRNSERPWYEGDSLSFDVDTELAGSVERYARHRGTTSYRVLLAAFAATMSRHTESTDIVIGCPTMRKVRARPNQRSRVANLVNLVPFRIDASGNPNFGELVSRADETVTEALSHGENSYESIVQSLEREGVDEASGLVRVTFALQTLAEEGGRGRASLLLGDDGPAMDFGGFQAHPLRIPNAPSEFDISVTLAHSDGRFTGRIDFASARYSKQTVERLKDHFLVFLASGLASPEEPIAGLDMIGRIESFSIQSIWNAPLAGANDETIHEYFDRAIAIDPSAVAVVSADGQMTYEELQFKSIAVAKMLWKHDIGPEQVVAICCEPSANMVAALLGVLRAGSAYLPIDSSLPSARVALMIEQAGASCVIGDSGNLGKFASSGVLTISLATAVADDARHISLRSVDPQNAAYVIFTSGSSGAPKAVQVEHRSVVNVLKSVAERVEMDRSDRIAGTTVLSFDISALELFGALGAGARLLLAPRDARHDPDLLADFVARNGISILQCTPTQWEMLLDGGFSAGENLKILCGGEQLSWGLARRLLETGAAVWNMYGPTEATIWSSCTRVLSADEAISIGTPISNTGYLVLDPEGRIAPLGCSGRLFITGAGLARGYLGQPALTAQRFVPNPFSRDGSRMYDTGDVVRLRSDLVTLEFLGRADRQIKIRGFRVDPDEIEFVMMQDPNVKNALVTLRKIDGENQLISYIVPNNAMSLDVEAVMRRLSIALPWYSIPTATVLLEALPLSMNGKVDIAALPPPLGPNLFSDERTAKGEFFADDLGVRLIAACEDILGRALTSGDNFFASGGSSLGVLRLRSRIQEMCGVRVPVTSLFQAGNIGSMAKIIKRALRERAGLKADLPELRHLARGSGLSATQRRIWFAHQVAVQKQAYNVPLLARFEGPLDREVLRRSVERLVTRHEVLRYRFPDQDGRPNAVISDAIPQMDIIDIEHGAGVSCEESLAIIVDDLLMRPFDLANDPLFRSSLIRVSETVHVLAMVAHHMVIDGWSIKVLLSELIDSYRSATDIARSELAPLVCSYGDYVAWERECETLGIYQDDLSWWQRHLAGVSRGTTLSFNVGDHLLPNASSESLDITLSQSDSSALRRVALGLGVTPFAAVVASFMALLALRSGQEDVAIGTDVANREDEKLYSVVGPFVNQVVLRTNIPFDCRLEEILRNVADVILQAILHQGPPFEAVVARVKPQRDVDRPPLFQHKVVEMPVRLEPQEIADGLTIQAIPSHGTTAKYETTLFAYMSDGPIHLTLDFDARRMPEKTAESLIEGMRILLETIIRAPQTHLDDVCIVAETQPLTVAG